MHIPAKLLNVPLVDRPFRVAAYCRVSSPSEERELSLETKVTYYTDKINGNELWVNAGVLADTATGEIRKSAWHSKTDLQREVRRGGYATENLCGGFFYRQADEKHRAVSTVSLQE